MSADLLLDAIEYVVLYDWHVFPLQPHSKEPVPTRGEESAGHLDAVHTEAEVRSLWQRYPNAGVGVSLEPSGLMLVDIDPRNGGDLGALAQAMELPPTLRSHTGGGGWHLFFKARPGVELRNKLDDFPGIDIKTRGYAVLPPSIHPNGERYEWATDDPPAPIIDEIIERCLKPPHEIDEAPFVARDRPLDKREIKYVEAALRDECALIAAAGEGSRNNQLARGAFVLGRLVGAGVLDRDRAAAELLAAAAACGLMDTEERMTRSTVTRQLDFGAASPRGIPDEYERLRRMLRSITASATPYEQALLYTENSPELIRAASYTRPELDPEWTAAFERINDIDGYDNVADFAARVRRIAP